jgi:hypothetical protein
MFCASCGQKVERKEFEAHQAGNRNGPLIIGLISALLIATPCFYVMFGYPNLDLTASEILWGARGAGFILAGVGLIVAASQRASRFGKSTFILGALGLVFEGLVDLIFNTNSSFGSAAWLRADYGLQGAG